MSNVEASAPAHARECLTAAPDGELFLPTDHHEFQRRAKAQGRRAAWDALCPVCRARVRLAVARRFRSRAIVLSILMIGNALFSAVASKAEMAPMTAVGGVAVCVLLAYMPVWLRTKQLHTAIRAIQQEGIAHAW